MMKPGPGVSPNAPRKTGLARLWELLLRDGGAFARAGLLALVSAVPFFVVVDISWRTRSLAIALCGGAAGGLLAMPQLVALTDLVLRSLRDEPGYWWHTYRRVWRRSFRSSLLPGAGFTALWACLLYARLAAAPAGQLLLSAAVLTAFQTYYWMQAALFDRPAARQLENALRMAVGFLPQTLAAAAVQLVYLALLPRLGLFGLLTGLWLPSLLALMLVYPPIERALGLEAKIRQAQTNC